MVRVVKPYVFVGPDGEAQPARSVRLSVSAAMYRSMWTYRHRRGRRGAPALRHRVCQLRDRRTDPCHARGSSIFATRHWSPSAVLPTTSSLRTRAGWAGRFRGTRRRTATSTTTSTPPSTTGSRRYWSTFAPKPSSPKQEPPGARTGGHAVTIPPSAPFSASCDEVFHTYTTFGRGIEEFHYGIPYLAPHRSRTPRALEEPKGRVDPLDLHVRQPQTPPARRVRHLFLPPGLIFPCQVSLGDRERMKGPRTDCGSRRGLLFTAGETR